MSTELGPLNQAKQVVALARETGDTTALAKLAALGDAVQKLALAKGARADALDAGEVYVRAMVALAEMDLAAAPRAVNEQFREGGTAPLDDLEKNARAEWRKLATASEIANLDDLIAYFREDEGNAGFSRAALTRAWKKLTSEPEPEADGDTTAGSRTLGRQAKLVGGIAQQARRMLELTPHLDLDVVAQLPEGERTSWKQSLSEARTELSRLIARL